MFRLISVVYNASIKSTEFKMSISMTASCLTHVNKSTEMSFDDAFEAYEQADIFTMLGFEVSAPVSTDGGATYTITITR